jgi:hypothetical protein
MTKGNSGYAVYINGVGIPDDSPIMQLTVEDFAIINPDLKFSFIPMRESCVFLDELWCDVAVLQGGVQ